MAETRLSLTLLVACACVAPAQCLFVSWSGKGAITDDIIFIARQNLNVPNTIFGKRNAAFENLTMTSLDDRCALGLPLTISFMPNQPYSGIWGPRTVGKKKGFLAFGVFPGVLQMIRRYCCNYSDIAYAKLLSSVQQADKHFKKNTYDFTFPIYVTKRDTNIYKDQVYIPVVQAPRVMMLIYDEGPLSKIAGLATTVLDAWPFLMFIMCIATVSGTVIWSLERFSTKSDFSKMITTGMWDGFWWAVVTMTTVGYGDRKPNCVPGRVFCIFWIITGINIISIFTALVTASVSVSTMPHFNIMGAKIGAVTGSEEFRLGVSMNYEMIAFKSAPQMTKALKAKSIQGILIDNYALTRFSNYLQDDHIRLHTVLEHKINYGLVMSPHKSAERTVECVKRYLKNYNHDVFDYMAGQLQPISASKSDSDYAANAATGLFHNDAIFEVIVRFGCMAVGSLILIGLVWEYGIRRRKAEIRAFFQRRRHADGVTQEAKASSETRQERIIARKRELMMEFNRFHSKWIDELGNVHSFTDRFKL